MNAPCRASTCDHLQVCNKPALVENLLIDGFFMELIKSPRLPADEHEIVLHNDGTWDPLPPKQDDVTPIVAPTGSSQTPQHVDTLSLDDSETEETPIGLSSETREQTTHEPSRGLSLDEDCIITLDSDSEEDEAQVVALPPKKRARIETNDAGGGSPELICLSDDDD